MNQLSTERRAAIVSCLCEGMGVNATCRITQTSKNTVLRLLGEIGAACLEYQDKIMRNLPCKRLQVDEIWSFCYAKEKNVPEEMKGRFGFGSVWTWTAIDAETKLIPTFHVGERTAADAECFISDLAARLSRRVQLTSDGLKAYLTAVDNAFGSDIDYGQLVKIYSNLPEEGKQLRYSPGECCGAEKTVIAGNPDPAHFSTSYVERANLTIRMQNRRFTRLTNGFSKRIENHAHSLALFFMHYNFVKYHGSLGKRTTPAMAAEVADHAWSVFEVIKLLDSK